MRANASHVSFARRRVLNVCAHDLNALVAFNSIDGSVRAESTNCYLMHRAKRLAQ